MSAFEEAIIQRIKQLEREVERLQKWERPIGGGLTPVFLTTPKTSTSWDGDARSDTSPTKIDLSAVFGVPAGVKAVIIRLLCRDSAAWGTKDLYLSVGPSSTLFSQVVARPAGGDVFIENSGICNCDANGDIYYGINASGTNTMDCWIEIYGWWL